MNENKFSDGKRRLPPICLMYFGGFLVLNSIFLDGDKQWLGFICGAVWFCSGYIVQEIRETRSGR